MFAIDDALLAEEKTIIQKGCAAYFHMENSITFLTKYLVTKKMPKLLENETRNFSSLAAKNLFPFREKRDSRFTINNYTLGTPCLCG